MPLSPPETLLASLRWRYATKKFDATRKLSDDVWGTLEKSLILTPSSFGLQPWKFLVVTSQEVKEELMPFCWGQRQVADCSHLVVLCAKQEMDAAYVDKFISLAAGLRGAPAEALKGYRDIIAGSVLGDGAIAQVLPDWAARQAYIALGQLMLSAALLEVDACPMEGFVEDSVNQALGLPVRGLAAAVLCPLGYRAADDKYATAPKVRWPAEDVIEYL